MSGLAVWTRSELDAMPRVALAKGSAVKPAVWRVAAPSGDAVVKDVGHQPAASAWLGRWLLARERRALERLSGLAGVPELVALCGRDAIATRVVPGRPLDRESVRDAPREFAERLDRLAHEIHARGVYHLDLHQRKNILVDDDGGLHVVDFGAALAPGPLGRALFGRFLAWIDRQAALKYLARFAPECLSAEEARAILHQRRVRRLWPFSAQPSKRESRAARERLKS